MITHHKNGWSGCEPRRGGKTDSHIQEKVLQRLETPLQRSAVITPPVGSLSATDANTSATQHVNQRVLLLSPESSSAPTQTFRSDYGNCSNPGHMYAHPQSGFKTIKTSTPQVQSADFKMSSAVGTAALLLQ